MRMGLLGMQAGLPLPSSFLANNPSLSPNLSSATASTARTLTDPPVVPDDADAHGSKESKDISDTAVSPSTSDTCTLKPTSPYRRRCRPGVRRYIFRTQRLLSGQRPLSSSTVGSTDTTYLSSQHTTSPSKNAPMAPPRPPLWSSLYFIHGIDDYNRQRKRWVVGGGGFKGSRADPKVFFSNERTYLHWIKFGLLLGSMALTLLSFGKSTGLHVGLFLVMVTMCTLTYATTTFHLRHRWMIHLRRDVKYYDRLGPTLLSLALFLAYAINVTLTMNKINGKYADEEGYNFYNGDEPLDV
ncbi:hypothetical protein B0O80DRAFT_451072 [Mortierella sp. GBAus27b]|nr:hypothetical protein B0O80DRAFT_451072 [Mortierella sp. GBAus27b]